MLKLTAVRDLLLAAPYAIDPTKLQVLSEEGRLTRVEGDDPALQDFAIAYSGKIILTDYAGDALELLWDLVQWHQTIEPGAPSDSLSFTAELTDQAVWTLEIAIALTETLVVDSSQGSTTLTHAQERDARAFDMTALFPDLPAT
ncbi:MAG: phage tail protein [Rhodospirillaceae bacterium]